MVLISALYTSAPRAVAPPDVDGPVGTVLAAIGALEAAVAGAIVAAGALSCPPIAEGAIASGVGGLMRCLTT